MPKDKDRVPTIISGAGGGGDKPRTPVEARDSLQSKQIAQIIDVMAEGEISGFTRGLQSVYLNETVLQNPDGTFNFRDVSVEMRYGVAWQEPFAGVSETEFEVGVGVEVLHNTPITRNISNPNIDSVRVTLGFPQLTTQNVENGDLNGAFVNLRILVQSNGGGYVQKVSDRVSGKTTTKYQRTYNIALTGSGPWDIQVHRDTPDSASVALANTMIFDSLTGITSGKLAYPNTAMVHMRLDAANFSSIPSRAYLIRGRVVRIPNNYDPLTRVYTGIWDGTFKNGWTDNPAWAFYDMLTHPRFGLGQFVPQESIDKWTLYTIARYCDQAVPNGKGGYEPRFTCNLYLQSREDAYKVIQNMASIFRGITYWGSGAIVASQDRRGDAIMQFTNANVVDGEFVYSGSSLKQRHTVALVTWNDPSDFYRQKVEYVSDDAAIQQLGVVETQITGFGCSSQTQAHRLGRWILATERYATEVVQFETSIEGCVLYPGAIFQTSDSLRAGRRTGGRIVSRANAQDITLDSPITYEQGHTYTISVMLESGKMESRTLVFAPDGTQSSQVTTTAPFSSVPAVGAVWVVADLGTLLPELWRVTALTEGEGGAVGVSGLAYVDSIYDNVERDIPIDIPPTSTINVRPPTPTSLGVSVSQYRVDSQITGLRALVSWVSNVGRFRVSWRRANGQWTSREVAESSTEIENVTASVYDFTVTAISVAGRESNPAKLTIDLATLGTSGPGTDQSLPMPTGLELEAPYIATLARFKWNAVPTALSYEVQVGPTAVPFVAARTVKVGNTLRFAYSPEDMVQDGGPFRALTIRVRAVGLFGVYSPWASLSVGNPQVALLQGIEVTPGIKIVFFKCAQPTDLDFIGICVWMGTDADFVVTDSNKVYDGPGTFCSFNSFVGGAAIEPGVTYYLKAAGYDALGQDGMNVSSSLAVTVYNNAPDEASIIASMIADGALTITKFADGIEPIGIVDVLPDPVGYEGPRTVTLITDGKLYILRNGVWQTNVAEVGPGSIGPASLNDALAQSISKIDGPETTPGTIANQIAVKVAAEANLRAEADESIGSITDLSIAASQYAIKASSSMNQALLTRSNAMIAKIGSDIQAAVYEEAIVRANALSAMAQTISGLSASFGPAINAAITDYSNVVASQFASQATTISNISTTVGNNTTAISQGATSINGLTARLDVKINNNGVISGYSLNSTTGPNGVPASAMTFAVDSFYIKGTSTLATPIFSVETRAGTDYVVIAGTMIKDGTITANALSANSITAGKIAAGAINTAQLAAGAITTDVIVVGTDGGIPGTMIRNGAISTAKIATGAITADKILANTIVAGHIVANAVTGEKILANSITADKIDARGLSIKDDLGNVILSANNKIDYNQWILNKPTTITDINLSEGIKFYNIEAQATKGATFGKDILGMITAANVGVYIQAAAIGDAYIGTLNARKITAGVMASNPGAATLQIGRVGPENGGTIESQNSILTITRTGEVGSPMVFIRDLTSNGGNGTSMYLQNSQIFGTGMQIVTSGYNSSALNIASDSFGEQPAVDIRAYREGSSLRVHGIGLNCHAGRFYSYQGAYHVPPVGDNDPSLTSAIVAMGNNGNYAFYCERGTVGPFTGSHDGLIGKMVVPDVGDIMVDDDLIEDAGVSNTIFYMEPSYAANQAAIGVFVNKSALTDDVPAAFKDWSAPEFTDPTTNVETFEVEDGTFTGVHHKYSYQMCRGMFDRCVVNSVGEGQINVCGEGGLELRGGDLIVTSTLRGKGMKQDDDIVRSYTVAKVRGRPGKIVATFESATDWKMVPCIYLCG